MVTNYRAWKGEWNGHLVSEIEIFGNKVLVVKRKMWFLGIQIGLAIVGGFFIKRVKN